MPTLKQLETALVNADKAGDEDAARVLAAEIKRMRAQGAPQTKPKGETPGRAAAFAKGALTGATDVLLAPIEYAFKGLNALGVPGAEGIVQRGKQDVARTNAAMAPYRQARPNAFAAGELVGQTAASTPFLSAGGAGVTRLGGAVASKAPRVGKVIQNVGKAVQTGGIGSGRTAAETAKLSRGARAGQLVQRATGGAIAGAGGAALTNQDVGTGAAFGAGLPVVGSVLKRVAGFAGDLTKLPRQKAAEIIRKSLENKIDDARAAFSNLSPDDRRLAEQVLIEAGVEPRTFFGIGKVAQEQIAPTPFAETLEGQAAARSQRLAEAAGGASMEEIRAAARAGRKAVSTEMTPRREAAFQRIANVNAVVPEAERIAAGAEAAADELTASGIVPRMRGLEERASEQASVMADNPAYFPDMERIQQTRGIAGAAGQRADDAIAEQIRLRDTARDMDAMIADMAAEGLQPARAAPILDKLRGALRNPQVAVDSLQSTLLKQLIRKFEQATDSNGMLDPRALGQIRKTGVNDIVEGWMGRVSRGAAPSSGNLQRASSLALQARNLIDQTLDSPEWREYLTRSERGYAAVNRGELAGEAYRRYIQAPDTGKEFLKLVEGNDPKAVVKIMGGGPENESFTRAFAEDPARFQAIKQSADELTTLNRMAELRGEGAGAAGNLMVKERPSMLTRGLAAATLSSVPSLRIGAQGAEQVERALMTPRVQREIANAFASGQNMNEIINTFPTQSILSEKVSTLSPMARNALAQMLRGYMTNPGY